MDWYISLLLLFIGGFIIFLIGTSGRIGGKIIPGSYSFSSRFLIYIVVVIGVIIFALVM